ncbi:MAG: hypothetical protein U5R14_00440 [Gemmatimonadota bacterium]|nr:hypothetical protein [Gemmatimonadota bacterium]
MFPRIRWFGCLNAAFVLLATVAVGVPAKAQDPDAAPAHGTVDLVAGFTPDPVTRSVRAGGEDANPRSGSACAGYIDADAPDFELSYAAGMSVLYIYARAESDLTLLIHDPDGNWHCNDDWEGTDPMVVFPDPSSGSYKLWVGVAEAGSSPEATLYFTELEPTARTADSGFDAGDAPMPDVAAIPLYETLDLSAGFTPDPVSRPLRAGGTQANAVPGAECTGYLDASAPDFDLNYAADDSPLVIYAESEVDLTLVVNDAAGEWHCSDDATGTDPLIRFDEPPSGNYNIWVGTYEAGRLENATLHISGRDPR